MRSLYSAAAAALANRDISAVSRFIACFSENADDLGQWRGYGSGECGYALAFRPADLVAIAGLRQNTFLHSVTYDQSIHRAVVDEVMRFAEERFEIALARTPGKEGDAIWARKFLDALSEQLDWLSSVIKFPGFHGEMEHRLLTVLLPGEHQGLEFTHRRTMLARHLPLPMVAENSEAKAPIAEVMVGPGPNQGLTLVGVSDMLAKFGYRDVSVSLSRVPFRAT